MVRSDVAFGGSRPCGGAQDVSGELGVLAEFALAREPTLTYIGVDASDTMRTVASARCVDAVRAGRAEFRAGAASHLPLHDRSVDAVVTVNNIRLWPDVVAAA